MLLILISGNNQSLGKVNLKIDYNAFTLQIILKS